MELGLLVFVRELVLALLVFVLVLVVVFVLLVFVLVKRSAANRIRDDLNLFT